MEINSLPDSLRNGAPVTLSWSGLFFHRCQAGAPGPLAPAYSRPADLGQHHAVPHLGRNSPLPCSSSTRPSGHRRQPPGGANQSARAWRADGVTVATNIQGQCGEMPPARVGGSRLPQGQVLVHSSRASLWHSGCGVPAWGRAAAATALTASRTGLFL